jgi:E3 ubiquitin-protein ligase UBR7
MPASSPCTLRSDPVIGTKGVHSQEVAKGNHYNHNFQNRFCGCGEEYDAAEETGTMYQCLGLGTVETGGCGEDWWHPECLMGLSRDWRRRNKSAADHPEEQKSRSPTAGAPEPDEDYPAPPGFPQEGDFETLLCYKCVEANPWIKQYAGAPGFLPPLFKRDEPSISTEDPGSVKLEDHSVNREICSAPSESKKRKALEEGHSRSSSPSKRMKEDPEQESRVDDLLSTGGDAAKPRQKHDLLSSPPPGTFSLLLKEDFRHHICHCPECYPHLIPHPQLVEEEDSYQPPVSESGESNEGPGSGARSHGTGSLLDRGEAALSTVDRVKAIEGVMVYNHLKDKVKDFLKPYAESGTAVGAEDIKAYFEKLRGDDAAIREARTRPGNDDDDDKENDGEAEHRREQSGY